MLTASFLDQVSDIAREAGERILDVYRTDFDVEHKDDASPLTAADLASNRVIVGRLGALTPHVPLLSEESAEIPFTERRAWKRYWLVDPLDGTREFVKRNGEFTVNIALVEGGVPTLGVVHAPVTGVTYAAAHGVGAFRDGAPIRVRVPARRPPVVAGSRSHAGRDLLAYLDALGSHELISVGSSLKFGLVAEGRADVYPRFGPTSEWDTAAGQAIAECAGAIVVDLHGEPLRYNRGESLINPSFVVVGDRAALSDFT